MATALPLCPSCQSEDVVKNVELDMISRITNVATVDGSLSKIRSGA